MRQGILRCRKGAAAIEFAIVAPVFMILVIGILDIGHMVYAKAVLSGAVQKAARESSLEAANTAAEDAVVESVVSPVIPNAIFHSARNSYFDFNDIARAERWNDADNDGICNNGESYTDENGNGSWDADIGISGNGGASDVVYYTMTVTYVPIFRIPFLPSRWVERSIKATAVKKNQPFADQDNYGSTAGTCNV